MNKNILTAFICATILAFCFQNLSAQIQINLPKLPKFKKEKPKTNDEEKSDNENNDNQNSTSGSAQKNILQVKPSSVGKIYFSDKPFGATNDGGKTIFTTGDYIYGRLETGGKTLREAFGFAPISKENPEHKLFFHISAYDPSISSGYGNPEGQTMVGSGDDVSFVTLTEADLDKTYWNFDVLPEPAKAATVIYRQLGDYRIEDENLGILALYNFLKKRAEERNYIVSAELYKKTTDFRGNPEPEEKWLTVEGRLSLEFKGSAYAKIKADQEKMDANRLARHKKKSEDSKQAAIESEPLPKEWTLKSNPLLPGLTESNLRDLFQKFGAHYTTKQIIKFYAAPYGSTAKTVVKNDLGIPKYRSFDQWFTIFAKVKFNDGEESCFYQNFYPAQEYAGGGTYGNLILITQTRTDVSCAKLGVK